VAISCRALGIRARAADLGLRVLEDVEHLARRGHQHLGLRGELESSTGLAEELHAGLPLQGTQLLRDRRRGEVHRLGDGRDRAADGQLTEEHETADVEHGPTLAGSGPER
jgi:hypothetical protein